jgi:hypothetical protein
MLHPSPFPQFEALLSSNEGSYFNQNGFPRLALLALPFFVLYFAHPACVAFLAPF